MLHPVPGLLASRAAGFGLYSGRPTLFRDSTRKPDCRLGTLLWPADPVQGLTRSRFDICREAGNVRQIKRRQELGAQPGLFVLSLLMRAQPTDAVAPFVPIDERLAKCKRSRKYSMA